VSYVFCVRWRALKIQRWQRRFKLHPNVYRHTELFSTTVGPAPTGKITQKVPYYVPMFSVRSAVGNRTGVFLHFRQAKYALGSVSCRFLLAGYHAGVSRKRAWMCIKVACSRRYVHTWTGARQRTSSKVVPNKISKNPDYGVCRKSFRWETLCCWPKDTWGS
jgi:hypothetical protein